MPDPFDPRFAAAVDEMARNAAARFRRDPWLVVEACAVWCDVVSFNLYKRFAQRMETRPFVAVIGEVGCATNLESVRILVAHLISPIRFRRRGFICE